MVIIIQLTVKDVWEFKQSPVVIGDILHLHFGLTISLNIDT